jgi:murein DD-endopeptidase MepM/ murein hydrolase activator NlpD
MRVAWLAIWLVSAPLAAAEEGVLYRLPWPEGLSFMFTQAPGGRVTTHFTKATFHAVDIAMPEGVRVLAARAGLVEALQAHHGASPGDPPLTYEGNFVRVRHADGTAATYAHLRYQGVAVSVGEKVEPGQLLGYSGASGDVLEPHLHFVVTREQRNSSGWLEEVSVPVQFHVGVPAIVFAPRTAAIVTANYSRPAEAPRAPSEGGSFASRNRRTLEAGDEAGAWILLALWLACGVTAIAGFWRFTREQ